MNFSSTKTTAAGAIVLLFAAAGCGQAATTPPAAADTLPPVSDVVEMPLPVVDPVVAAMQNNLTNSEINGLIEEGIGACMADQGLEYTVLELAPSEPVMREDLREFRSTYGYGFHSPPRNSFDSSNDSNLARMQAMDDAELRHYLDALEGADRFDEGTSANGGGCRKAVEDALAVEIPILDADPESRMAEIKDDIGADSVREVGNVEYSQCMATAGYDVQDPFEARGMAAMTETFDEERTLALADVDCQESSLWIEWDATSLGES